MSKRRKRAANSRIPILPAILIVMVVLAVLIGVVLVRLGPTASSLAAATSAGSDFMNALQTKNYAAAYAMITSSYQAVFGSPDVMQQELEGAGWEPSSFSVTQAQLAPSGKTVVTGTGTFNGATKYVSIYEQKFGDTWEITGFEPADNRPTDIPGA